MGTLESWTAGTFGADGLTHPTYRRGAGPGVIVIHELPGMTPDVIDFADEVVDRGFTVVMPHLFGTPEAPMGLGPMIKTFPRVCVSREFNKLKLAQPSPVTGWLRALAHDLHLELGGPGVGAIGMCFTGGFALAMMIEPAVVAPVLAQPSLPFAVSRRRAADLGVSKADLDIIRSRAEAGCPVLGLRYADDRATGTRFDVLTAQLGSAFTRIEFPGAKHSTLTAHRQQAGVDAVLDFLDAQLRPST